MRSEREHALNERRLAISPLPHTSGTSMSTSWSSLLVVMPAPRIWRCASARTCQVCEVERCSSIAGEHPIGRRSTQAASIADVHRFARWPRAGINSRPCRMDWASVESSRNKTPLWAREMAPGLATRWPPPTMLAIDAEWCGSL
jgi:glycine/D-amino acid oxidase-like deaminating enzyme